MGKTKVKINRGEWGRQVTGSGGMQVHLWGLGQKVAGKLPGSSLHTEATKASAGGLRARAIVSSTVTMAEEAETGAALSALQSVVSTGHRPKSNAIRRAQNAANKAKRRGAQIAIRRNRAGKSGGR